MSPEINVISLLNNQRSTLRKANREDVQPEQQVSLESKLFKYLDNHCKGSGKEVKEITNQKIDFNLSIRCGKQIFLVYVKKWN